MKKICILFDLHVGNYNFIFTALSSLNVSLQTGDKVYLLVTPQSSKAYQSQAFKNFLQNLKPKFQFLNRIYDESKDFGTNLKNIVELDTDGQLYIFKTTLPVTYYENTFKLKLQKDYRDNWYVLPSIDSVLVPDRKGQIIKVREDVFVSSKSQQYVDNVKKQLPAMEPDYFIFGKQFLNVLFMINEFKQKNFVHIVNRATQLKKPIQIQQKRLIKKYWNCIPNNNNYAVIPQFVMPIVQSVTGQKAKVLRFPTIVGNIYFKNSNWLPGIISNIQNITYIKKNKQQITGLKILDKIAIKYDMDINTSLYIRKFIKQILSINPQSKFDFYTRNHGIKLIYQRVVANQIFDKINWIQYTSNIISNVLDYQCQIQRPLKFDFNYYAANSNNHDQAISQMLSMGKGFDQTDKIGKIIQPTITDTIVALLPLSQSLCTKNGILKTLNECGFKKAKIFLEPVNVTANNQKQFIDKVNRQFEKTKQNLVRQFKDVMDIDIQLFLNESQQQYVQRIISARQQYSRAYVMNHNILYTLCTNFDRKVIMRGN